MSAAYSINQTATLPCPFCGDTRPASIEEVEMKFDPPNLFVAVCQCCAAQGPCAKTRGAAIVLWDQRRTPGDTKPFTELANRLAGFGEEHAT
jgi:Lar family restriction alleviation protein